MEKTILRVVSDKEQFHRTCAEIEKERGESLGVDFEEFRQDALNHKFDLEQGSKAFNLGSMCLSACNIAKTLATMGYQAFYAPKGKFFLTSDSPVFTLQDDGSGEATIGMGFGWENVEVYCPLNKRTCFRLKRGIRPMGRMVAEGRVDQINHLTMATAAQYLYSAEGHRRIARLFDERGCKIQAGKNAFMPHPRPPGEPTLRL